jgi:hypothetical protein
MAMFHQKSGAMFLRLDRKRLGELYDFDVRYIKLTSPGCTRVLTHKSGDYTGRFLRQLPGYSELLFSHCGLVDHCLQIAGAISQNQKMQFPLVSAAPQPPANRDFFSNMSSGILDIHMGHAITSMKDMAHQ